MVGERGDDGKESVESVDKVDRGVVGGGRGGFRNRGVAGLEDSAALRSRARRARRGVPVDEREASGRGVLEDGVEVVEDDVETVDNVDRADDIFEVEVEVVARFASMPIVEAGRRGREGGGNDTRGDALVVVSGDRGGRVVDVDFAAIVAFVVVVVAIDDIRGGWCCGVVVPIVLLDRRMVGSVGRWRPLFWRCCPPYF